MKTFLRFSPVAVAAAVLCTAAMSADFHEHIGLQLYSLREQFKTDVPGTLDLVKSYGITEVETAGTAGLTPEQFVAELKSRGLNPVSAHVQYGALEKDAAAVIREVQALGAKYAFCPWIPHEGEFNPEGVQRAAANFNTWGAAFRAAGIKFGYHTHGYEFVKVGAAGETLFDQLVAATKPENLCLEMDVFWVVHAGVDPVALLNKYPGRWVALHVKDMRKGAPTGFTTGRAPATDKVSVGSGMIDWPAVLRASEKIGVTYFIVEDECVNPLETIPPSLVYLRGLKL